MGDVPAPRPALQRALRDGLVVAGLLFLAYLFAIIAPVAGTVGFDAFAYWSVDASDPYQAGVGGLGAFNYTPPIAGCSIPVGALPWLTFLWLWLAALFGTVIWLGRWSPRVFWILALPPVALELYHGNVHLLIAAAIVLGFRHPWTWAFVLLTKVTPGRRPGLVRGPSRVATPWDRAGRDGGDRRRFPRARRVALDGVVVVHHDDAGGWQRRAIPDRHPVAHSVARGPGPRGVGRPDRSTVDGPARRDPRAADPVGQRVRDLRRDDHAVAPGERRPVKRPVRWRAMTSLTLVLPAYNEAERIEPALDELFGYLRRRGETARDGAPGAAGLPSSIDVLVVDDGSTDGTAAIVEGRSEATRAVDGSTLRVMRVPHGGKGAAVRAGMRSAEGDLVIFADADMATPPDQLPLLVAALARQPTLLSAPGFSRTGRICAQASRPIAGCWARSSIHSLPCGSSARSRTPSAASRGSRARQPRTCSPVNR